MWNRSCSTAGAGRLLRAIAAGAGRPSAAARAAGGLVGAQRGGGGGGGAVEQPRPQQFLDRLVVEAEHAQWGDGTLGWSGPADGDGEPERVVAVLPYATRPALGGSDRWPVRMAESVALCTSVGSWRLVAGVAVKDRNARVGGGTRHGGGGGGDGDGGEGAGAGQPDAVHRMLRPGQVSLRPPLRAARSRRLVRNAGACTGRGAAQPYPSSASRGGLRGRPVAASFDPTAERQLGGRPRAGPLRVDPGDFWRECHHQGGASPTGAGALRVRADTAGALRPLHMNALSAGARSGQC